jgi:hypothetical protein
MNPAQTGTVADLPQRLRTDLFTEKVDIDSARIGLQSHPGLGLRQSRPLDFDAGRDRAG